MFKWFLPTAVAMVFGLLVLLGSLFPIDLLVKLRAILIPWATVLGAFALILAYLSILRVHLTRLVRVPKSRVASLLVFVSAVVSLGLVLWKGPEDAWTQGLLNVVLVPGESALLALTAVILIVAGARILRVRRGMGSIVFVVIAVVVLLSTVPYVYPDVLKSIVQVIDAVAMAGMRGLLMGVALGITLTGLRIILGVDRPHSDE